MQGRIPKPGARQPNRGLGAAGIRRLPRAGRQGKPPAWPLPEQTAREAELWRRLWQTPCAVAWEELGWVDQVARYARVEALAELGDIRMLPEARQLEDRLGLSPIALLRLRWEIVDDEVDQPDLKVVSVRERLKAVE